MTSPEHRDVSVPNKDAVSAAIEACLENGSRLIDDAYQVEFQTPAATKLMLCMIAQEEVAKAFLLFMVDHDIVPWSRFVWRATNDHSCKQLVGVILDYLTEERLFTKEEMDAWLERELTLGDRLPEPVASAIDILRHEKIRRWESNTWEWVDPPNYDRDAVKIAEGRRDRIKQDALYVRLGRDASVVRTPDAVTKDTVDEEFQRARRYCGWVCNLVEWKKYPSREYEKVCLFLRAAFAKE